MANPLPNEQELYNQIQEENITIAPDIWDLLYHRIGDDVTAINLLCRYYLTSNQPIPIKEAEKILLYTNHIKDIVDKVTVTSEKLLSFPEFINDMPLHPILREMFTHYIGNDTYMITLIVGDSIDPLDPKPVSLELIQKVLNHTTSIRNFMERLRIATSQEKRPAQPKEPPKENKNLTKEEVFARIKKALFQEFNLKEDSIHLHSRFREDLGLDSVDTIRSVMALEEEFGFEIPDEDADGVLKIAQAVDYISKKLTLP